MAEKTQNTSIVKTNSFIKGMQKDYSDNYISEGFWISAINAINNTHNGELGTISNEPSNKECASAPYAIIGYAYKNNGKWVLFSTNQGIHGTNNSDNSDIGIFDEATCNYTSIFNAGDTKICLDFAAVSPITAVCKENYDCTWSVYWQDGHNVDRTINLDKVPYISNPDLDHNPCTDPGVSQTLDCDAIRLHPLVSQPCLKIRKSQGGGQLINGSYMATIAYSEKGIRLTDYSMPSDITGIWSHEGVGGSIDILVDNADTNYDEYELVIIATVNQQTIAKKIGNYPISNTLQTIHLDQILQTLLTIDLSLIPMKNIIYEKSDKMFEINNHLIRCGVTSQPYFNYQPQANLINAFWTAVKYPKTYYFSGGTSVGYMRDEVYAFFIRWIYNTGARSASYHIPGRKSNPLDMTNLNGADPNKIYTESKVWETYNTATYLATPPNSVYESIENINPVKSYSGTMGYWESTEKYPVNTEIWTEDLCNTPIRHHKMPSDETIPLSTLENGEEFIYVLGVNFNNISHPLDENGDPITDIVGYEILRGSREGNKSIVAKGIFNNMIEYNIFGTTLQGLFQNYPYNDLRPDPFLTTDAQHFTNSHDVPTQLNTYRKDIFSFHSPETTFLKPYIGNSYIKLSRELVGKSTGNFEVPYQHPKHKLITDFAFTIAIPVSVGIGIVAAMGKTTFNTGVEAGVIVASTEVQAARDAGSATAIPDLITNIGYQFASGIGIGGAIATIAGITVMLTNFVYYFGQGMDQVLSIIRNVSKWRDYMLQFNSHGVYDRWYSVSNLAFGVNAQLGVPKCIRRQSSKLKYIGSHIQDFDSQYRINNINRNKYVCVQVNSDVENTDVTDVSKSTVDHSYIYGDVVKTIASYYGSIKIDYQNQYGQLESIIQVPTNSCIFPADGSKAYNTDVIFGGDVYINRYTEKNPYMFFNSWMIGEPDGQEYDYRNYVNGPVPSYWMDTSLYDLTDTNINFSSIGGLFGNHNDPNNNNDPDNANSYFGAPPVVSLPSHFFRLDENPSGTGFMIKKNAYAYLFYNGVRDFFVESELNLAYRDYGEDSWEKYHDTHYSEEFNNLSMMFRSDLITKSIYNKYDMSLSVSKLFSNYSTWGRILPRDYDPQLYNTCFEYYPRRTVYSLKQTEGLKRDNWKNYLPLNYKDFDGIVSVMKQLNATGNMILFEDDEPIFFQGVDQLQTTGDNKFLVGDGGLFANVEQTVVNADDAIGYGNCISSRSAVNTPHGLFWISQQSGKILNYTGNGVEEISRTGMKFWFNENLPSQMLKAYPDYPHYDNPIIGVACQTIYDSQNELLYFIKKDHLPLGTEYTFDENSDVVTNVRPSMPSFYTSLVNPRFFENASWVASYDPKIKAWISFHTWKPSIVMPSVNHFYTVDLPISNTSNLEYSTGYNYTTGKTLWKHNERWDDYCTYYNEPSYWEIEYPEVTPNTVTTIRNIEYTLECFRFSEDGKDMLHILDENFDRAMIYNSEQVSGLLYLNLMPKSNPFVKLSYPQYVPVPAHYEILFSKEENKYRFNQFWDITRERGEFNIATEFMFNTSADGFTKILNPIYANYTKPVTQRKKFRHYGNRVVLRRVNRSDGSNGQAIGTMPKMVFKLSNNKLLYSSR